MATSALKRNEVGWYGDEEASHIDIGREALQAEKETCTKDLRWESPWQGASG